ncbi:MAG: S41 family peptidase [Chthoniobacteraceae bacterium]
MKLPFLALLALGPLAHAQSVTPLNARLMQMPAVSRTHLAFVHAGDIWLAPRGGGQAVRLSSPRGTEQFPRFSPDGSQLAFSANYDGDTDLYVMPVAGGEPLRVTHHGANERLLGWYPDGQSLLFHSAQESFTTRTGQFYKVPAVGGLPERLPVPYGEFGAISPDGKLVAYTPITTDFATWKRYRGGMTPDIWLFDLDARTAEKIAPSPAKDTQPMWHGTKIYFLSDRDERARDNLWCYDTATRTLRQITHYTDFDIHFPSIGPDALVYENGGRLHLLDLATEKASEVVINIVSDQVSLRQRVENVSGQLTNGAVGPTGKRALFEARGDIFSVPAEHGVVRNVTATSGTAERFPAWSPDGKWIAYFSDKSGEYELTLRPADGKGDERTVTKLGAGFRYQPHWSPDSKHVVFIDSAMRIHLVEVASGRGQVIDKQLGHFEGALRNFRVSWSADSRWIAYARDQENNQTAIVIYDTKQRKAHQVTSGFFEDDEPVFDPDGRHLYYRSQRWFDPIYSDFEPSWIYANGQALIAVPLRKDLPSPLAPRDDEEPMTKPEAKPAPKPAATPTPEPKKDDAPKASVPAEPTPAPKPGNPATVNPPAKPPEKKAKDVLIDFDGFEARAIVLPPRGGRFEHLSAVAGKLIFQYRPRAGMTGTKPIAWFDLENRAEKQIIDDASNYELTADSKKMLVVKNNQWDIINIAEGQKFGSPLPTAQLEATVDPRAEWMQLFTDAWRIERDFFYDPGMHGVDWPKMRERYGALIRECNTRGDVNYVLGELLGEINSSHTYRSGGDLERVPTRPVGYIGCDFALERGAYRIKSIPEVAPWEYTIRSPLRAPGVKVKEGDWLLAVNGKALDISKDPWAAFVGLADKPVFLTVNDKPVFDGAREVLVQTIASEQVLRQYAWIESNRRRVEKSSDGKIGYIYVESTAAEGQNQLYRQFRAQFNKPALIIDERWNSGGQIPDRFVELLGRRVLNYYGVRDGKDWQTPTVAHRGPKAMLANGWSGSGGDCFPFLFRESGLGPVIGTRTWGGLIGMTGAPPLIDGGSVTVPTFAIYNTKGEWIIEGHGVDPDIEVIDDPAALAAGGDPQLERAVTEMLSSLGKNPATQPAKPAYPKRVAQ